MDTPSPLDNIPDATIESVQRMIPRESHPWWGHAAYADLARRLIALSTEVAEIRQQLEEIKAMLQQDKA